MKAMASVRLPTTIPRSAFAVPAIIPTVRCVKGDTEEEPDSPVQTSTAAALFCVVTAANKALCVCDQGYMRDGDQCIADPCLSVNCGNNGSV